AGSGSNWTGPAAFGRIMSLDWPISDGARYPSLEPVVSVTGNPARKLLMPENDHPAATLRSILLLRFLPKGSSHTCEITSRCGTSNCETARLFRLLFGSCCAELSLISTPSASEMSSIDFAQV